ncbi:hypothetical protein PsorP6_007782 [Peronosclerospora sorghi]|uniref:Uncharacterized protein n=1 Tax=Peronosclerospora sorghi TaxID=230839 RepID=A0ACC0W817_9STRA|nr:hypothetical protein PsorP6_007782 [Peronosclerospora sorghi]
MTPASHRAVSSFSSPPPRAVKKLLQTQVMNVLRHVARHFPLFPLEKAALYDAVTRGSNVDERMDEEEEEEEEEGEDDVSIYALVHHVDCYVCHGNEGELLGCTACPGSYHRACLSDMNETHPKCCLCPDCRESSPKTFPPCTSSTPGDHERVPADLRALFEDDPSVARSSLVLEFPAPCANARRAHFEQVFASISNSG